MNARDVSANGAQNAVAVVPAVKPGHLHPVTQMIREIQGIFAELGFEVSLGPELEREYYNFDALNIPTHHPARDMQDTFWIKDGANGVKNAKDAENSGKVSVHPKGRLLLTTQTSAVQIRYMETHKPPFRTIVPGKVFRNEATDSVHEAQFYQIEALYVDKKVSLGDLKGVLTHVFKRLFGPEVEIRFRPSFFPFVEPGVEVDMKWRDRWLEVVGAGLVHPNVLRSAGIDPTEWKGFAFALGLDRLVMLRYGIDDIRQFYNGDLRFVNQF